MSFARCCSGTRQLRIPAVPRLRSDARSPTSPPTSAAATTPCPQARSSPRDVRPEQRAPMAVQGVGRRVSPIRRRAASASASAPSTTSAKHGAGIPELVRATMRRSGHEGFADSICRAVGRRRVDVRGYPDGVRPVPVCLGRRGSTPDRQRRTARRLDCRVVRRFRPGRGCRRSGRPDPRSCPSHRRSSCRHCPARPPPRSRWRRLSWDCYRFRSARATSSSRTSGRRRSSRSGSAPGRRRHSA